MNILRGAVAVLIASTLVACERSGDDNSVTDGGLDGGAVLEGHVVRQRERQLRPESGAELPRHGLGSSRQGDGNGDPQSAPGDRGIPGFDRLAPDGPGVDPAQWPARHSIRCTASQQYCAEGLSQVISS